MTKDDIEATYNVNLDDEEERGRLLCALEMTITAMDKNLVNCDEKIKERAVAKIRKTIATIKQ